MAAPSENEDLVTISARPGQLGSVTNPVVATDEVPVYRGTTPQKIGRTTIENLTKGSGVTLAGTPDYIQIDGPTQVITRFLINLATHVTGILGITNGGTGSSTAAGARTNLGVDEAGTDNSVPVSLTGTPNYITISGASQIITRALINLATHVTGILGIANGGTGASTAAGARTNLDVDQSGTDNSTPVTMSGIPNYITLNVQDIVRALIDLTSHVTGLLPVANGGTGAADAPTARTNLGAGTMNDLIDDTSPQLGASLDVNGQKITSTAGGDILMEPDTTGDLILDNQKWPQADGSDQQVLQTDGLGQLSWGTPAGGGNVSNSGTPVNDQLAIWTNATAIEGSPVLTSDGTRLSIDDGVLYIASQPAADANRTGYVQVWVLDGSPAEIMITDDQGNTRGLQDPVTLAGVGTYLTLSGQEITVDPIDLSGDVTGVLPITNGGTSASTAAGARTALGVPASSVDLTAGAGLTGGGTIAADRTFNVGAGTGIVVNADDVAVSTLLAAISALTPTDGNFIVGNGSTWVTESGVTARASMGVQPTASPTFTGTASMPATDFQGNVVEGHLSKVVSAAGALTAADHSGNILVTSDNVIVPLTVGFTATIIAGGAHTVAFNSLTSTAMAAGDVMTVAVEEIGGTPKIKAVLTEVANLVSFS